MHGRLKVRTSAEEAARKKKEQEQKVILYRAATEQIHKKRANEEWDQELLDLTSKILSANPDVYTLWNVRKECVLKFAETEKNVETYDRELYFTEMCLQVNPKSYGAWHHRCWILENSPEPNWQREVDLCTKYLKYDERNFHCWDYRRFVVERAKIPAKCEFDFCTEKIEKNFSNYSSWHYRSKLLPLLYPHETDSTRPICEEKLKEELELVLTAAFTDPNDSSAWFYQRWLLGYSAPKFDIAAFKMIHYYAVITFTTPINLNKTYLVTSNFTKDGQFQNWQPLNENEELNQTWWLKKPFEFEKECDKSKLEVCVKNTVDDTEYTLRIRNFNNRWVGIKLPKFEYEFGRAVTEVLSEQLKSCEDLLNIEPDSKWTLLTAALLMRAINRNLYHSKTLKYLQKLQTVDPMRCGYYQDLASKWSIQYKLEDWIKSVKVNDFNTIDLSNLSLTSIHYEVYMAFFDKIDLSNNQLTNRNLAKLKNCQLCFELVFNGNKIDSYDKFPRMEFLGHLFMDKIKENYDVLEEKCENLVHLNLDGQEIAIQRYS